MGNHDKIVPYDNGQDKKNQVANMFNNIAHSYDFLNHFFSVGIDKIWRKKVVKIASQNAPNRILDVATGTGDLAIALSKTGASEIQGIDISSRMLEIGRKKVDKAGLTQQIVLNEGDGEQIAFDTDYFDLVTASFGVRNFENLEKGLLEFRRVLTNNGQLLILEFSKPNNWLFRKLYYFYFCNVLPFVGKLVSKDKSAYHYLPESVKAFPDGKSFIQILEKTGFRNIECIPLTFGISSIYLARK